jgi:hypothetical protein
MIASISRRVTWTCRAPLSTRRSTQSLTTDPESGHRALGIDKLHFLKSEFERKGCDHGARSKSAATRQDLRLR